MAGRAVNEFNAYYDALCARIGNRGRAVDGHETRKVRALHDAATVEWNAGPQPIPRRGGWGYGARGPLQGWDVVEARLVLADATPDEPTPAELATEVPQPQRKRNR